MKTAAQLVLLLIILAVFMSQCNREPEPGPEPRIVDQNFLNALIEEGVDADGDGLINTTEAESVDVLDVSGHHISRLQGIELFINLVDLNCSNNQLTTLEFLQNTALEVLDCSQNQLISLDITHTNS